MAAAGDKGSQPLAGGGGGSASGGGGGEAAALLAWAAARNAPWAALGQRAALRGAWPARASRSSARDARALRRAAAGRCEQPGRLMQAYEMISSDGGRAPAAAGDSSCTSACICALQPVCRCAAKPLHPLIKNRPHATSLPPPLPGRCAPPAATGSKHQPPAVHASVHPSVPGVWLHGGRSQRKHERKNRSKVEGAGQPPARARCLGRRR